MSTTTTTNTTAAKLPTTQPEWQAALDALPANPPKIPAFFFGHGSPMLAMRPDPRQFGARGGGDAVMDAMGPAGPLAAFLRDFGPALLKKYNPRAIVVFSAHWETAGERVVTDYGDENPLLYDYYGFQPELYELKFKSRGDAALAKRIVELYKEAGQLARTTSKLESRGHDGRGFNGPGLDHGVFVPFRLMFGESLPDSVPVVQVSIDSTLSPEKNWAVGKAVRQLREEGVLVLSGGLTVHNLRDFSSFSPATASSSVKAFNDAVTAAIATEDPATRKRALLDLPKHPGFRGAHPREEHFVPLYVAAGAGDEDGREKARVLSAIYGAQTVAFGV
ncbi:Extradiol ring-cleavage dioxygenase class III enzyme subunit B [Punctularia strigosozonata HHB-11173 SS5]|uniref:Extradiol ring-cleavage dioxygenase class III enzyme subunit B n=1 Tax=Punctularia strigosozonata (strain HHB-11173) TaxID=741275 RepID=UPI0004416D86|nr:Extradiol ring-cleavage dioxygenase class III enzyme subunit B [Punctularia strigosozonata HHB-11173 SS5]EIN07687.1 Extradiol ring-cleavage dioxygenase class III enzyme subunit B [Punctularia strigosozonata HHB-11173 SS5]